MTIWPMDTEEADKNQFVSCPFKEYNISMTLELNKTWI